MVPSASEEVVNVATPPASVPLPITTPPSLKRTVPVGVPDELVTVAVKVTACPTLLGLTEDVSVVVLVNALT
jgi:hypothetical protein